MLHKWQSSAGTIKKDVKRRKGAEISLSVSENKTINFTHNHIHLHRTECVKFRNSTNRENIFLCVLSSGILSPSVGELWLACGWKESRDNYKKDRRQRIMVHKQFSVLKSSFMSCSEEGREQHKRISPAGNFHSY